MTVSEMANAAKVATVSAVTKTIIREERLDFLLSDGSRSLLSELFLCLEVGQSETG